MIEEEKNMEHNYENCRNLSCKRKSEKFGMLMAYQSVEEEIDTIKAELTRRGFVEPKEFSALEGFVADNIRQLN